MKEGNISRIQAFVEVSIITIIINCFWEYLEMKLYGSVQPRVVDDIIAVIYGTVIYYEKTRSAKQ